MDRGFSSEFSNIQSHYPTSENRLCSVWNSRCIVTDNGTCFTSVEFEEFLTKNGISHKKSAPYHPATNEMAERAVQFLKQGLKNTEGCLSDRIAKLLFTYHRTLHSTTGVSPAKLLIGRDPKSRLDLLKPDISCRVEAK